MSNPNLLLAIAHDLALDRRWAPLLDRAAALFVAVGLTACLVLWRLPGVAASASALHGAAAWLGAVAVQPLVEETLFRGLLQGQLLRTRFGSRLVGGISAANLSASAAFVAAHFVHHTPQWALATLPPSLALGWLRERRDSTWAPIAVHAAFNLEFFATAAAFAR